MEEEDDSEDGQEPRGSHEAQRVTPRPEPWAVTWPRGPRFRALESWGCSGSPLPSEQCVHLSASLRLSTVSALHVCGAGTLLELEVSRLRGRCAKSQDRACPHGTARHSLD